MTPTTTLDYRLIFALMNGKVSTALRRRLNADFRAAGLEVTGEQWDVLMAISSRDLCTAGPMRGYVIQQAHHDAHHQRAGGDAPSHPPQGKGGLPPQLHLAHHQGP